MRGQAQKIVAMCYTLRITPADAGTRQLARPSLIGQQDHPRGCGDKLRFFEIFVSKRGSPPRMRGQGSWWRLWSCRHGITPADAGTRFPALRSRGTLWDHPRGCGDKYVSKYYDLLAMGSPPRMRGQVISMTYRYRRARITPADAGTSSSVLRMIR